MKYLNTQKVFLLLLFFLCAERASASYYGRFISGGFFSKEVFRDSQTDRYNDVAILSERLFVNFDKIAETNTEFTVDIRDKHNFFDKLNSERIKLISDNKIQLDQFNLHSMNSDSPVSYTVGRFPLSEAGSVFVDGVDLGFKQKINSYQTRFSLFYGLNPEIIDEAEIKFNTNAKVLGGYFLLEQKGSEWEKYLYSVTSLVQQTYKSETDRLYFYNNTVTQASSGQNFSSILYLELKPKVYVQNFWATYITEVTNQFKLRSSVSTVDSLHYSRTQDIREELPSSRYHQTSISLRSPSSYNQTTYETKITFGLREVDKKNMAEVKFGFFIPQFIQENLNGTLNIGVKKDFVLNAAFFGGTVLHSNKMRELSFSQDFQLEKKQAEKLNLVFITEGSYTRFFDRSLFGIVSLQNIWDNKVSIFSVLFKLSYRFGEGGQAPIRDGSPPMGQL
jgi:hypothetical protein